MRFYLQRKKSWFNDNFLCVADENREMLYDLKCSVLLVKTIQILDAAKNDVAVIKQELKSLLPKYSVYVGNEKRVTIKKLFNSIFPKYELEGDGWEMRQETLCYQYELIRNGRQVATITRDDYTSSPGRAVDMTDAPADDQLTALAMAVAIEYGINFEALQTAKEKSKNN